MSDQQEQPLPEDLTPEDVARAIFAAARPPDPRLRRDGRLRRGETVPPDSRGPHP